MARHSTGDKLNNLPADILENIFSRLSIKVAGRTSVLSTDWRNKWVSFPHLLFSDERPPFFRSDYDEIPNSILDDLHNMFVRIVNHVLSIHKGPILSFKISSYFLRSCSEINHWILSLSPDSVKEFELEIARYSKRYRVTRCLFSFKHLIRLKLVYCIIKPPPLIFNGFRVLKSLLFNFVDLSHARLKSLLSLCPELQRLSLINVYGVCSYIELTNPKLKHLTISGDFIAVCHHDLKHMDYARINFSADSLEYYQWKTIDVINVVRSLLCIRRLELGHDFLEPISCMDVPRKVLSTNDHLKSLCFFVNMGDMGQVLVALCVLNSTLNLQDLRIQIQYYKDPQKNLGEVNGRLDSTFDKLQSVAIYGFSCSKFELILVKYILANSPSLETMKIFAATFYTKNVSEELLLCKRASPQAEILYSYESRGVHFSYV